MRLNPTAVLLSGMLAAGCATNRFAEFTAAARNNSIPEMMVALPMIEEKRIPLISRARNSELGNVFSESKKIGLFVDTRAEPREAVIRN